MSSTNKLMRRAQTERQIQKIMKDPRFKDFRQQDTLDAFNEFLLISVDYLFRTYNYGQEEISRYMEFVTEQVKYATQDDDYYRLLNDALVDDVGVDILGARESGEA